MQNAREWNARKLKRDKWIEWERVNMRDTDLRESFDVDVCIPRCSCMMHFWKNIHFSFIWISAFAIADAQFQISLSSILMQTAVESVWHSTWLCKSRIQMRAIRHFVRASNLFALEDNSTVVACRWLKISTCIQDTKLVQLFRVPVQALSSDFNDWWLHITMI